MTDEHDPLPDESSVGSCRAVIREPSGENIEGAVLGALR